MKSGLTILLLALMILSACILATPARLAPDPSPLPAGSTAVEPVLPFPASPSPTALPFSELTSIPASPSPLPGTAAALETAPVVPTPATSDPLSPAVFYTLSAQFDYRRHRVDVQQQVAITNTLPIALPDLLFDTEANRMEGVFSINSIQWGSGEPVSGGPVSGYSLESNRLHIPLLQPLEPGQTLELRLDYRLSLPVLTGEANLQHLFAFGYTGTQTNIVDWYPALPVYRDGWLVHEPSVQGEHTAPGMAGYDVTLELVNDPPAELVVAASSAPEQQGNTYHYHLPAARSFALTASPDYQVTTQQVGEITVTGYAFPFHAMAGKAALENAAQAIAVYQDLFGPYPHTSYSLVEADFPDGMEYDGLAFLGRAYYDWYDGSPTTYMTFIGVHETAHEWWYAKVGNDQALEPWLDEALCTYSEKLFFERIYPDLVSTWRYRRITVYEPEGWVNATVYDYQGFRPYVNAIYLRGVQFLEALRQRVGDEAFFAFLKDYAAQYSGQTATAQGFFRILNEHTSANWDDLKKEYFKP